jgi:hypothetical protein
MRSVYVREVIISLIIAVFLGGTGWAAPELDLGSASGKPGEEVTIPIYLTTAEGTEVAATSNDITYDTARLTPVNSTIGKAGQDAGKSVTATILPGTGVYRVAVYSVDLRPIGDGIVANVIFRIDPGTPAGTYQLGNKPYCSTPEGKPAPVTGNDGFVEVNDIITSTVTSSSSTSSAATTSTTTSAPGGGGGGGGGGGSSTTTVPSSSSSMVPIETTSTTTASATTSVVPDPCVISITPSSISVASGGTAHFTASAASAGCAAPQFTWSIESPIGSTINADGDYRAGNNSANTAVTETILVVDHSNNSGGARATVSVSPEATGGITSIAPESIASSWWLPRLHLLVIHGDQGAFKMTSVLAFKPAKDITPLATAGLGNIMLALVSVKPGVQGLYDVSISTGSSTLTKKDCLSVRPPFSKQSVLQSTQPKTF